MELFRGPVERIDVIVARVKKIANLFVGLQRGTQCRRVPVIAAVGEQRGESLLGSPPPAVQAQEDGGQLRGLLDHELELRQGDIDRLIDECVAQLGQYTGIVVFGKKVGVDTEACLQQQQHARSQRTVIVLDLVQVAGGYIEQ